MGSSVWNGAVPLSLDTPAPADFESILREEFRRIKAAEEARAVTDRQVKEQILADLDGVVAKHSPPPPKSMKSVVGALAALVLFAAPPAYAAVSGTIPYLSGPADPSQLQGTINQLIQNINAITSVLLPQGGGIGVNAVSIPPAVAGVPAMLGVQQGGESNAGISISPNGTGNVILFGPGQGGGYNPAAPMGMLQIDNQNNFVPASVATCPGATAGTRGFSSQGPHQLVTGFWTIQDAFGNVRYIPLC